MKLYPFLVYLKVQKLRHFSANGEKLITPYCLWFSFVLSLLGEKYFILIILKDFLTVL